MSWPLLFDLLKKTALSVFFGFVAAFFLSWSEFPFRIDRNPTRWAITGVGLFFGAVAIAVWFRKRPAENSLALPRVEGSKRPTYRIKSLEDGKTWYLVLGKRQVSLLDSQKSLVVEFGRELAGHTIKPPGFVNGRTLRILTRDRLPSNDPTLLLKEAWEDVRGILTRRLDHGKYHEFRGDEALTREIRSYCRRGLSVLGPAAAVAFRRLALQQMASGGLLLAAGLVMAGIGWAVHLQFPNRDPSSRGVEKLVAVASLAGIIGLARGALGAGNALRARRLESNPATDAAKTGSAARPMRRRRVEPEATWGDDA